jgi:hypothetical protein
MTEDSRPMLRVVAGGEPTAEELAALVAVLGTRQDAAPSEAQPLRRPLPRWVASALVKGTRTRA